jgi:hypothetical protein
MPAGCDKQTVSLVCRRSLAECVINDSLCLRD